MTDLSSTDRTVLTIAGALVVLGVVGIGLLEMLLGSPHPVTGEGQIVHEAIIPLAARSYIILLGFAIWGFYGIYRFLTTTPTAQTSGSAF